MNYVSQHGQDKWVIDYFNFKKDGYFIDLAAGDGVFISNTYLLEKELNWKGICVEANNNTFEQLQKNRSVICDNNCILDDISSVEFINTTKITEWEHLLSGIKTLMPGNTPVDSCDVKKTISLNTLLNNHNSPEYIDYISLDVEGAEFLILENFFKENKRKVKLWSIEHGNHEQQVIDLMLKNNYKHLTKIEIDNIFELIE
jgi:FkbM family methyltransferase